MKSVALQSAWPSEQRNLLAQEVFDRLYAFSDRTSTQKLEGLRKESTGEGTKKMRYLRFAALLSICLFCASFASAQRVVVGVGVGPAYVGPPPVCAHGYYDYHPYACAPYGYYGPKWFVNGVFIGAGPWYHSPYWDRGYYGRPGYYSRGWYGRRWRRDWDRDEWREREFHRDWDHDRWRDRDGRRDREWRGDREFRGHRHRD